MKHTCRQTQGKSQACLGGIENVLSPVANLKVRQRILYELAWQDADAAARERARDELDEADLNPTQKAQLQALLESLETEKP